MSKQDFQFVRVPVHLMVAIDPTGLQNTSKAALEAVQAMLQSLMKGGEAGQLLDFAHGEPELMVVAGNTEGFYREGDMDRAAPVESRTEIPTRVVIHLQPDGQSPIVSSDRPVEVAILRSGLDLEDFEPEDMFTVPVYGSEIADRKVRVAGRIDLHTAIKANERDYVEKVFAAVQEHGRLLEPDAARFVVFSELSVDLLTSVKRHPGGQIACGHSQNSGGRTLYFEGEDITEVAIPDQLDGEPDDLIAWARVAREHMNDSAPNCPAPGAR